MSAETPAAASAGRSGAGGASADSYIGSLISLTSKSEIRYEGILYNINTEESSIGLRNVRSFGTEGRKKDGPQVPPSDKIYDYILFRGTDIKDLQVKASPPLQTTPSINSDPAIIQSHYPHPNTQPTGLATAPAGSFAEIGSHSAQMGHPSSTFQSGLPLYQPGGNMNSWVPSPPNANGSGLPMPMYWQGYYGSPNGLPQLPQQSLLRPPLGLSMAPSMQQMQFSALNSSFPATTSSMLGSSLPDNHSSVIANSTSSSNLTSTNLPAPTLSSIVPPPQPFSLASETMNDQLPKNAPLSSIPASAPSSGLPSLAPFSVHDNVGTTSSSGKSIVPVPTALPQQIIQPVTSVAGTSAFDLTETPIPPLITPGQLLQSGPPTASAPQPLQTTQKDVEIVQMSPKLSSDPSAPIVSEAQPPILPLPPNASAHKPSGGPGGSYHMHNNYRGRGGRGSGNQRPTTKFTEEFDFMAMNEKFKKDEVWGRLGKGNRSQSKEGVYGGSDEEDREDEYDVELPEIDIQPVYNKDDFFDSLSCNALERDPNRGRPKYSEQMKLDTETFGEFSRYRGGRGPGRGGGRFRGSSYGRGYGGYGYVNRGRGRGVQSRAS